ncbi:MAG: VacB/RNase II family 3'-5' exoribonuclease [Myxococcales bacterium]|nr:MAG: VacB/RNase II family 3'-5' exoribonuclease [Myxococcales bacterium]
MRAKPAEVLALFDDDHVEWRYRDLARTFDVSASERREFKSLLASLVHTDALRLRQGKWYRKGAGALRAPSAASHLSPAKRRKILVDALFAGAEWPTRFSDGAIAEALSIEQTINAAPEGAADLTAIPFVTIDPADAKDFDDAVAAEDRPDADGVRLWVAIADVSRYVPKRGAIDRDALDRTTSVYVPGGVEPMLPHELSSGICSLKPNENRMALAARLDYTPRGRLEATAFVNGLMRSRNRLSYPEAQDVLDGKRTLAPEVMASFARMENLFRILLAKRLRRGSLDLDVPEAKVEIGDDGGVAAIEKAPRFQTHRLIEEFMLAANEAVAETLARRHWPCLYRIHEAPDEDKMTAFGKLANAFGHAAPSGPHVTGLSLNQFLRAIAESEERDYLNMLLLRSLKQAAYSTNNRGHFGLALKRYCHFTSPIRRYPDLEVHRQLKALLNTPESAPPARAPGLAEIASHCSDNERRAMEIERKAVSIAQAEFMADKLGEQYDARISGVTHFGFFVQVDSPFVEGLVGMSQLRDDYYQFDERLHTLFGERTRRIFRLGDRVVVRLAKVDTARAFIDFDLIDHTPSQPVRDIGPQEPRQPTRPHRRLAVRRRKPFKSRSGKGGGKGRRGRR